ncbi:hypothetical protein [Bradyrhizobium sp. McL0616]|uniref:hypothetical protein n=1 Tax=Bradyrhizobium sp. McL0616 TaxID=3415674 RepID=UPI003CEC9AA0
MRNIIAFPGNRPASNICEPHNPSFDHDPARWRSPSYKSSGHLNMHTFSFRSYDLSLLQTMRMSLREIAKYGKHGPT